MLFRHTCEKRGHMVTILSSTHISRKKQKLACFFAHCLNWPYCMPSSDLLSLQHLEVRTVLPTNVCTTLDGSCGALTQLELAGVFKEVADEFSKTYQLDTCGVTMIFAPIRGVSLETVEKYVATAKLVVEAYPNFFMGFDLVGKSGLLGNNNGFTKYFLRKK